jgi:hypothetical protein
LNVVKIDEYCNLQPLLNHDPFFHLGHRHGSCTAGAPQEFALLL